MLPRSKPARQTGQGRGMPESRLRGGGILEGPAVGRVTVSPERAMDRRDLFLPTFVIGNLAYVLVGSLHYLGVDDEGCALYGALRVLAGDLPYRDFWSVYSPGQMYLLAGAFKVFGASLLVERAVSVAILVGGSVLAYFAASLIFSRSGAVLTSVLWTVSIDSSRFYGNTMLSTLTLSLAAWLFLLLFLRSPGLVPLLASALLAGVVTLFRQDFGAYNVLAALLPLTIWYRRWIPAYVAAAVSVPAGAVVALVVAGVPASELMADVVWFPLTGYAAARRLPWPALIPRTGGAAPLDVLWDLVNGFRFYFPLMALIGVGVAAAWLARRGGLSRRDFEVLAVFGPLTVLFLNQVRVRPDMAHSVPTWVPAFFLLGWLVTRLAPPAARLVLAAAGVVFGIIPLLGKAAFLAVLLLAVQVPEFTYSLPRARGITDTPARERYEAVIEYIRREVAPDEPIYVGNYRHDMGVTSDVLFYFLAERHSATKYHELVPGVTTRSDVQASMVEDLRRARVRYVILRRDIGSEPSNESSRSSGVHLLDRYIEDHFRPVMDFGNYLVARRRE